MNDVDKLNEKLLEFEGLSECKICFDSEKRVDNIIVPCGHLFCCSNCVSEVRKR